MGRREAGRALGEGNNHEKRGNCGEGVGRVHRRRLSSGSLLKRRNTPIQSYRQNKQIQSDISVPLVNTNLIRQDLCYEFSVFLQIP